MFSNVQVIQIIFLKQETGSFNLDMTSKQSPVLKLKKKRFHRIRNVNYFIFSQLIQVDILIRIDICTNQNIIYCPNKLCLWRILINSVLTSFIPFPDDVIAKYFLLLIISTVTTSTYLKMIAHAPLKTMQKLNSLRRGWESSVLRNFLRWI